MHSTTRLQLRELNPHLLCVLCGGYLIDATTIIECIHSFCRTCIIKYLESSKYCPICDVQVHKTKPLLNVRSDKTLQTLVYKLVPSLFKDEMRRRREFYAAHPDQSIQSTRSLNASELRGEVEIGDDISTKRDDEQISLCLQSCAKLPPYQNEHLCTGRSVDNDQIVDRRFLLCPSSVTIGHLKKLIRLKFDLPPMYRVDIFYSDEGLRDSYTLLDVAHIYSWRRVEPLKLYYIVHDRSLSQLHLSPPSVKDMVKHRKDGRAANKRSISLYTIRMSVSDNENADSNNKVQNEESGSSAQPASGIDNDTDRDGGRVPNKGEEDQHESSKEEGKENVSRDGEHGGVAEPAAVESAAVEPAAVEPAAVEPAAVENVRTVGEVTGDEEKDKGSPRDQMEKCLEEGASERHDEVDTADSAETAPEAAQRTQNDHVTGEGGGATVMDANKSDTHSIKEDGTRPSVHVLESEGRQGDRTSRDGGDVTGKPSSAKGKANGAPEVGKPCNKKAVEQTDGQTPREAGGVPSEKASAGSDKPEVVRRPPARVLSSQSNNNKLVSSENDLCSAGRTTAQRSQPANGRLGAVELKKVGMLSRGLSNGGQRWLLPNCLPNQPHLQRSASPRYVTMADGQQYPVLFVGTPDALCPVTFSGGGVSLLSAIQSSGRSGSTGAKQMNCFFRKNSYVMAPRLVGVAHARDGPSGGGAIRPDGRSEPNGERRPKTGKDQTGYSADATWRGADPLRNGSSSSSEVGERSDGDAPRLLNGRDPVAAGANRKRSRREDALDCKPSKVARRNGVDKPPEELCNGKTVVTTMAIEKKHVVPNA